MERKIGEIFEYKGEWYQCVADTYATNCTNCHINDINLCNIDVSGYCTEEYRKDGNNVCFKKLEKVGEPYEFDGHLFQSYYTLAVPIFTENYATVRELGNNSKISIEIKQNQEDMKEKKLNLKPFDLEAARNGKPVCTRDGRKARIICFDAKGGDNPIVALYEHTDGSGGIMEIVEVYHKNGKILEGSESWKDLMMLSEKHEGWINIYKTDIDKYAAVAGYVYLYKTEEEAKAEASPGTVLATVKIEWEE